jgi:hypothetical protein
VDEGSRGNAGLLRWGGGKLLERIAFWPKCSSIKQWRSDSGNGMWFLSLFEEVVESRDCMELGIADGGGSIVMALEMASRLWIMVPAGVTVKMVR